MNDPMYSDLFDQCKNTGGKKVTTNLKKGNEIGSASNDWTNIGE